MYVSRFCLDAGLLGTDKHLIVEDGSFSWSETLPGSTWRLTGQPKDLDDWCLDTAAHLARVKVDPEPPARFINAMSTFSGSLGRPIPWQKVMPAPEHRAFTKRLVEAGVAAMDPGTLNYLEGTWKAGNSVLRALQPAAVNGQRWRELVAAGEGNVPAVKSFCPMDGSYAAPVRYSRLATLTGRLTVVSGPQILTLKKEHRDVIASRYGDKGCVVSVDFSSLEARILLYETGVTCNDDDLYAPLARKVGTRRNVVKGILISMMYGGSGHAAHGINGSGLASVIRQVDKAFGIKDLTKRLKAEFIATGRITNRYGRKIVIDEPLDRIFINYFAQSTGVDVALLGFSHMLERLRVEAPSAVPLYVLHDGLYLDVQLGELDAVKRVKGLRVEGYGEREFPVKIEVIAGHTAGRAAVEAADGSSENEDE